MAPTGAPRPWQALGPQSLWPPKLCNHLTTSFAGSTQIFHDSQSARPTCLLAPLSPLTLVAQVAQVRDEGGSGGSGSPRAPLCNSTPPFGGKHRSLRLALTRRSLCSLGSGGFGGPVPQSDPVQDQVAYLERSSPYSCDMQVETALAEQRVAAASFTKVGSNCADSGAQIVTAAGNTTRAISISETPVEVQRHKRMHTQHHQSLLPQGHKESCRTESMTSQMRCHQTSATDNNDYRKGNEKENVSVIHAILRLWTTIERAMLHDMKSDDELFMRMRDYWTALGIIGALYGSSGIAAFFGALSLDLTCAAKDQVTFFLFGSSCLGFSCSTLCAFFYCFANSVPNERIRMYLEELVLFLPLPLLSLFASIFSFIMGTLLILNCSHRRLFLFYASSGGFLLLFGLYSLKRFRQALRIGLYHRQTLRKIHPHLTSAKKIALSPTFARRESAGVDLVDPAKRSDIDFASASAV